MKIKKHLSFQDKMQRVKKACLDTIHCFAFVNWRTKSINSLIQFRKVLDCVDEQMCSTKLKHHFRQYMPKKPHKWGIKLFVLCDSNGFAYRFEIYNGAGDIVVLPGTHDLGATSNVVVRLSRTIPDFVHHIIYFDNFYTSLPLLVYLRFVFIVWARSEQTESQTANFHWQGYEGNNDVIHLNLQALGMVSI